MDRSREETPGRTNAQLEGFSVPTHSPWDTSAFVPESAIPRVLFRKQKQVSRLQSSHNNSWGWVSLLVAWNALTRSILLACDFVKASQCIAIVTKEEDVMCFRPPDTTSGPLICPECGKKSCHRISDQLIAPSVRLHFRPKALPRLLRQVEHQLLPALRRCQVRRSLHLGNSSTDIMA